MSVSIQSVSRFFGAQAALKEVNLEVPGSQVLGLLGPNGAGKSTLMRLITGYLPPSSGTVLVCGLNVEEEPIETKRRVGYLPEHNPVHLDMYVREYLDYVARLHGLSDRSDRVHEIIAKVGLDPEAHKLIGQLSKGYRQRVGLAQALIHEPDVLILDEPTSGLDPIQLVGIRELIREVGKKRTVILSTHIMQEVEAMCERVVLINRGELVADGDLASFSEQSGGLEAAFHSLSTPA
jgi:ABC-2 type transport system ATP-binding protein